MSSDIPYTERDTLLSLKQHSGWEHAMDLNMQKEQFSRAYVQAVAACAGYAWSIPSVDDDSIDMSLHQRGGNGTIRSPRIELQIKCTSSPAPNNGVIPFVVKKKNLDDLCTENVLVPRILVVVLVPDEVREWLKQGEREMAMRHCGYWMSLRGVLHDADLTSQTVYIPRKQMFTVESLREIMQRISRGELP